MSTPYIGEVKLVPYNFAPQGWAFCAGQILPISQNTALFALLGTMYGGNGTTTFALPDLRGRVAIHSGTGAGLSTYVQGQEGGVESISLDQTQIPPHGHAVAVSSLVGNQSDPTAHHIAVAPLGLGNVYGSSPNSVMGGGTSVTGSGNPHENRQPYLALNYIIALFGVFPPRP